MSFGMKKEMSGLLRGLILRRRELPEAVEALWRETPDQRHRYLALVAQECGFTSRGRAVLRDLLMLMFREHDGYLDAITIELSRVFADRAKCEATAGIARNGSYAMAYEYKNLAAWHHAANRTIARLRLLPVPLTLPGRPVEDWMRIKPHQNVVSLVAYRERKSNIGSSSGRSNRPAAPTGLRLRDIRGDDLQLEVQTRRYGCLP